jgi:hypothetical protein
MSIPPHPSHGNEAIRATASKRTRVLAVLVAVAVIVVIALHLTGVVGSG